MTSRFPFHQYARATQHFASARALEVLALQASPFLGAVVGGIGGGWIGLGRLAFLLAGSLALTAHVFVFNDWAGRSSDVNDPRRCTRVFGLLGIDSRQVAGLSVALLVAATFALAMIGVSAVLLGAAIAALSLLYSCSPLFGKGTPIVASLIHLVGGTLHFLLGYTVFHSVDARGVAIGIFFGLIFAGGHLNQEVRDHDGDSRNEIRTNAVVFGCRRTFVASLLVFTTAYVVLAWLALLEFVPRPLLWCLLLWPWHFAWSVQAFRHGLGFEAARWMQRRYRVLFAILGLAMLLTALPIAELGQRSFHDVQLRASRGSLDATPNEPVVLLR